MKKGDVFFETQCSFTILGEKCAYKQNLQHATADKHEQMTFCLHETWNKANPEDY